MSSDYEIDTTNNVETNQENYYTKIDTQTITNTITELSNICKENIASSPTKKMALHLDVKQVI